MIAGNIFSKTNKSLLVAAMLLSFIAACFTVFCYMPDSSHSYNLLMGKDQCQESQSADSCGSVQSSGDVLGFNLLNKSLETGIFLYFVIFLLGFVIAIAAKILLPPTGIVHRFRFRFLARLFNYLIQAFSQGILNPRLFAI